PVRVQCLSTGVREGAVTAAPGVVADQDVEVAEGGSCLLDQDVGCVGVAEIKAEVTHSSIVPQPCLQVRDDAVDVVCAPWLLDVVRAPVVDEQARAHGGQARRDSEPDSLPAADPGDDGCAPG